MPKHLQVSGTPANGQVPVYNSTSGIAVWTAPSSGSTSDATASAKGIVQLAGDLGGTAAAPTVPGLAGKLSTSGGTISGALVVTGDVTAANVTATGTNTTAGTLLVANAISGANKAYRFRTSGSNLDWECGGADLFMSVWSDAAFSATQRNYLRLEAGAQIAHATGQWQFTNGPYGSANLTIDGGTGTLTANNDITSNTKLAANGTSGYIFLSATPDGGEYNLGVSASGKLALYGSSTATLDLNLLDGALYIASTLILSNARVLQNVSISGANNTITAIPMSALNATGTPSSTTFLRGDGAWATPTGGGTAGITRSVTTSSANVTLGAATLTDYVNICTGGTTYTTTLPTAVGNTNLYTVKNASTVNQTVATTSSQTIDGSTTVSLTPNTALSFISDGTNWQIV